MPEFINFMQLAILLNSFVYKEIIYSGMVISKKFTKCFDLLHSSKLNSWLKRDKIE